MLLTGRPPPRPISRLLIANRGEIAARILSSALELSLETYTLHTTTDTSHTNGAHHSLLLSSPAGYMDIPGLVKLVKQHDIDAVHPGYGFLSESAEFAKRMWEEAGCVVVGPGWDVLERTGDKLAARRLAEEMGVPVLAALVQPTGDAKAVRRFADEVGYPIMVKAVDGGGGRGIRLVRRKEDLESSVKRAVEESPSKKVFAEKAAVDGFLHIEVQIVGDGKEVLHLFERQCSIQRRYQKVVEIAPCVNVDRRFIAKITSAAVTMAKKVNYFSLGTFEFLANPATQEFYFLEINPRLQVEHTITESICGFDLVCSQLLISQGDSLGAAGIPLQLTSSIFPPSACSIQLRITAEDVRKDWSLSVGKITGLKLPHGNGIRVDTALEVGDAIGSDFDSLLVKIVVTAQHWPLALAKARRALSQTRIEGVKTNLEVLRGIIAHPDFAVKDCDTRWLEDRGSELLKLGEEETKLISNGVEQNRPQTSSLTAAASAGAPLFRKGDAWTVNLTPTQNNKAAGEESANHLQLTRIYRNDFPNALAAELTFTSASGSAPQSYKIEIASTAASGSAVTSHHRRGNPNDPRHVIIPFPGKLVEVCVDEGDLVKAQDVICVVQQMKMEIEIRAPRAGRIVWLTEVEDGEEVNEGILAAEIEVDGPKL